MGDQADIRQKLSDIEKTIDSQNGEDGIIEYLVGALHHCNKTFLEFGCGNGKKNNCTQLARHGWFGIAIDQKQARIDRYRKSLEAWDSDVVLECARLDPAVACHWARYMPDPDVFSIDLDSIDYHIVKATLEAGFTPSIAVVEYNSGFMMEPATVPPSFNKPGGLKNIYFGAGLAAWQELFNAYAYEFVTVESSGVNAFFVNPAAIDRTMIEHVDWLKWADSPALTEVTGLEAYERWEKIRGESLDYVR